MFVLQCFIKSGFMTNSLLAVHPAVQHMVLHLMNINAGKHKWSSGTGADGWETPADGIIIQRGSPHVFLIRSPPQLPRMLPVSFQGKTNTLNFQGISGYVVFVFFLLVVFF